MSPYRRFRAWKLLFLALENLNATDNMTIAGFADKAHFSHSFGVNPAYVFRGINRFEV